MRLCACGKLIPNWTKINGRLHNIANRTRCFDCLPFQQRYTRKPHGDRRTAKAESVRRWYAKKTMENKGINPIRARRIERKALLIKLAGGACQICGYSRCNRNIAFHHLYDKKFALNGRVLQYSLEMIAGELLKCVLVCHNCHGEIHDSLIEPDRINQANRQLRDRFGCLTGSSWDNFSGVAQLAEQTFHTGKIVGSSPSTTTKPEVVGSIPTAAT